MGVFAGRVMPAAAAAAVLAGMMSALPGDPASAAVRPHKFVPPKVQRVRVLPRTVWQAPAAQSALRQQVSWQTAAELRAADGARADSSWPAAGSGLAVLPPLTPAKSAAESRAASAAVPAGGLPVLIARDGTAGTSLSQVTVSIPSHAAAARAGVSGVLFTLDATGAADGRVNVTMRYGAFRNAGGADFAGRLRLAELPACAVTTPEIPACQVQTPLQSVNDPRDAEVSAAANLATAVPLSSLASGDAQVPAAPALSRAQAVLALVSGPSGSNGAFTATSLSPAGTWTAGGSSGDFAWSYPITVPPPAAGAAPQLSLDYNSASVDGRTAQTNNQFGMVGEGFTLSDNYIERSYTDCADDPEGAIAGMYDNCWAGNVVTMSLDGRSTALVYDSSKQAWHEQQDTGDLVQYQTGTAANTGNGTYDNGYWVITTPDGTQYYFGKNKGPGWASGDAVTNSAWTEPVYGPHSGDPCYKTTGFASTSCPQAWRWNLDFVIDPNGNTTAYYYTFETNYYGADNKTTGVQYDRAGYLSTIQYGLRDENNTIYGTIDKNPPEEVVFHPDQRCISTTFSCAASAFTSANAKYWPDTPQDQQCLSGAVCNNHAPTFWSQMRIDSITTQYYNGSGYTKVDVYKLGQSFPTTGDPELELDTITRTGYDASGASLPLPPVDLTYQLMDNRVPGYNSEPSMAHWRLTKIETETGEVIMVQYSPSCTASQIPSDASTNTTLCYPVFWAPYANPNPILDYFNKYVVGKVTVEDGTAGSASHVAQYTYLGAPAWHYDDNQVVKAKYRTYGQFRGYGGVEVLAGDPLNNTNGSADQQTMTETTYYRGMYGDTLPSGTRTTQVSDSLGENFNDTDALAGLPLEVQTFNGYGGAQLTDKITEQQVVQVTGSQTVSGLPTVQSSMTGVTSERDFTDLADGTQQELTTATTYDSDGRPVLADRSGTAINETCTQTTYDDNKTAWIRDAVGETVVSQQPCPSSPGNLTAADIISDTRTFYDGATSTTTPPTQGSPTEQDAATSNNSGTLTWRQPVWTKTYDSSGRVQTSTDGLGNPTSYAYTPADGGPLTQVTKTNAANQPSTQAFDPGRGSLLTSTDTAGYETSYAYDQLGRVTSVWKPGRSQSGGATANITYAYPSYKVMQSSPLAVTTNTLIDYGTGTSYLTSISIYDSLGQLRQTQTAAEGTDAGGDTAVTGTSYDSHGWVSETDNRFVVAGSPSTQMVSVAASAVNDRTLYAYDGAGRVVDQRDYDGNTLTDSVQTVQGGNQVTTIRHDAAGNVIGTPSATVTNVLGRTADTIQYAGDPTVSSSSVVSGGSPQTTAFSYDAAGNRTQITDPGQNAWTYAYDMVGEQTSATDPDTGTTQTTYDAAGNIATVTDANGTMVNYTYDGLNRKKAEYTGSLTQGQGTKVGTWVWDTLKKGLLSYETSINPASGLTYQDGNLGYDSEGDVSGTWVTVPAGQPLAGTYETQYAYSTTGQLLSESPAAGGGLPVDSLTFTYDKFGNRVTETGYDKYVSGAIWTPYNEISQIDLGSGPSAASLTYTYDPQTRNVTSVNLSDNQPSPQVDNTVYGYNADRQVTTITDTQGAAGSAPVETQCFNYDGLSRLWQAWTATDNCAANPSTAGNSTVNGPQPYWQSWTFDSLGDIQTQTDHATAGSSSGDNTTQYTYNYPGHAHAVGSVSTVNSATGGTSTTNFGYDNDGNMNALGSQALNWNVNGALASVGTTSYTYDANGHELTQTTPSGTTLFLPGEQITANGSTTTGMRYYTFGGVAIGETTGSALYWTESNRQGTLTAAVNAFSESSPAIYRTFTPYGTPVTGSGAWPDDRTFLNDPANPATGLVDVGARKYDPALALFISVDPLLDPSNPQTMTGYNYAADNPATYSDPTGLCRTLGPGAPPVNCNGDPITPSAPTTSSNGGGCGAACLTPVAAVGPFVYMRGSNKGPVPQWREGFEFSTDPLTGGILPTAPGQGLSVYSTPEAAVRTAGAGTKFVWGIPVSELEQLGGQLVLDEEPLQEDGGPNYGHLLENFTRGLTADQAAALQAAASNQPQELKALLNAEEVKITVNGTEVRMSNKNTPWDPANGPPASQQAAELVSMQSPGAITEGGNAESTAIASETAAAEQAYEEQFAASEAQMMEDDMGEAVSGFRWEVDPNSSSVDPPW